MSSAMSSNRRSSLLRKRSELLTHAQFTARWSYPFSNKELGLHFMNDDYDDEAHEREWSVILPILLRMLITNIDQVYTPQGNDEWRCRNP